METPGIIGEWSKLLLNHPERLRPSVALEMTRLDIARDLVLLTFNAEMAVNYGLFVKSQSQRRLLPLGYTNGMIGYVPTAKQLSEGGYESNESFFYFGLPSPLHCSADALVRESIRKMQMDRSR